MDRMASQIWKSTGCDWEDGPTTPLSFEEYGRHMAVIDRLIKEDGGGAWRQNPSSGPPAAIRRLRSEYHGARQGPGEFVVWKPSWTSGHNVLCHIEQLPVDPEWSKRSIHDDDRIRTMMGECTRFQYALYDLANHGNCIEWINLEPKNQGWSITEEVTKSANAFKHMEVETWAEIIYFFHQWIIELFIVKSREFWTHKQHIWEAVKEQPVQLVQLSGNYRWKL